jgi:prepilin-type N-terminal cleavage/methylation domain-containing protein
MIIKNGRKINGFTLIELLVVIAIIGLLASVIIVSLGNSRMKARDVRRISDLGQVKTAMELFHQACNGYPSSFDPATDTVAGGGACNTPGTSLGTFLANLPVNPAGCSVSGGTDPAGSATAYGYTPDLPANGYTVWFCSEGAIAGTPIINAAVNHRMVQGVFVN